mmetsp:Transcript_683/g.1018  ORF Transcript_683/g.1018 Transcript_683/m.1018 type:complete len:373 (+) Transcript_683:958-2076(+)
MANLKTCSCLQACNLLMTEHQLFPALLNFQQLGGKLLSHQGLHGLCVVRNDTLSDCTKRHKSNIWSIGDLKSSTIEPVDLDCDCGVLLLQLRDPLPKCNILHGGQAEHCLIHIIVAFHHHKLTGHPHAEGLQGHALLQKSAPEQRHAAQAALPDLNVGAIVIHLADETHELVANLRAVQRVSQQGWFPVEFFGAQHHSSMLHVTPINCNLELVAHCHDLSFQILPISFKVLNQIIRDLADVQQSVEATNVNEGTKRLDGRHCAFHNIPNLEACDVKGLHANVCCCAPKDQAVVVIINSCDLGRQLLAQYAFEIFQLQILCTLAERHEALVVTVLCQKATLVVVIHLNHDSRILFYKLLHLLPGHIGLVTGET